MKSHRSHMFLAGLTFALLLTAADDTSSAVGELRVYRPDGSVQCGKDGVARDGRSLAEDRATIEKLGAKVIAEEKKKLPLSVITLCGIPTGNVNTFLIPSDDWKKIKSSFMGPAGFAIWPYDSPTVIVFQYDGSTQCEGGGISLEDMAKVLTDAGIKVINQRKFQDGLLHPAACGFSTGTINAYEIASSDLDKALDLGFSYMSTPDMGGGSRPAAVMATDGHDDGKPGPWPFPW